MKTDLISRLRKLSEDMKSISDQMKKENGNPLFRTHAGELYGASEMVVDWIVNLEKSRQSEFAREQSCESVFTRPIESIVDVDN